MRSRHPAAFNRFGDIAIQAHCDERWGLVAPEPSFFMYKRLARVIRVPYHGLQLSADFDLDQAALARFRALAPSAGMLILCSPNNPTGNSLGAQALEEAVGLGVPTLIDEAYSDYARCPRSLKEGELPEGVMIGRTLSKVGLAALRVGFLIGRDETLRKTRSAALPFAISSASMTLATAALSQMDVLRGEVAGVVRERDRLIEALGGLEGLAVYPSDASFILCRARELAPLLAGFAARGLIVKSLEGLGGVQGHFRMAVGSADENDAAIAAIRSALDDR
jgi:histidinol-phosphate aminotransferase